MVLSKIYGLNHSCFVFVKFYLIITLSREFWLVQILDVLDPLKNVCASFFEG